MSTIEKLVKEFIRSAGIAATSAISEEAFEEYIERELTDSESETFDTLVSEILEALYPKKEIPGK